jgi:3-oxoacyl-[acyl-carrier-protein] synthase II
VNNFIATDFIDFKKAKRMSRFSQFALAAAIMAKKDSNIEINEENNTRIGVVLGVGSNGDLKTFGDTKEVMDKKGPQHINPFAVQSAVMNSPTSNICVEFNIKGRSTTISTGCSSSLNAIGYAYDCIKLGKCDAVFSGGTEAPITPVMLAAFSASGALSKRNQEPCQASRPFERDRDGYVLGEGAGILVVESYESAVKRNAKIYAEIRGYATTSDAYSTYKVEPSGEQAVRCFAEACKCAEIEQDDVDYVSAHGSSSPLSDRRETDVIKKTLGQRAKKVMISSLKSMIGHPLGAAGVLQTISAIMAMKESIAPPTINLKRRDSDCDLDYVPNEAREKNINLAVINSLGIGGNNASLVVSPC